MSQSSDNEGTVADISQVDLLEHVDICSALNKRTRQIVTKIENIKVGSEISYGRWGYKHHAVVVDVDKENDKYQIIHLSGDSVDSFMASSSSGDGKAKPRSEWMTMRQTKKDKSFYYDYKTNGIPIPFEPDVIKGRAEALMKVFPGSVDLNYHVQKFNCQHFASYCVTGVPYCKPYNKMMCCCKRGTAINSEVKQILDDQLKGTKTPSPEKERADTKKDQKPTNFVSPKLPRQLPSEPQHLKTDNSGRAQVFTENEVFKSRPLPHTIEASTRPFEKRKKRKKKKRTKFEAYT